MALAQRLDLRQSQSLVMTPQLQQAIKLLQLSNLELTEFVETELERNPLLEREENGAAPVALTADPPSAPIRDSADAVRSDALPDAAAAPLDYDGRDGARADDGADWGMVEAGVSDWGGGGKRDPFEEDDGDRMDRAAAPELTLRDHIVAQIGVDIPHPADRLIALHLLEGLEESGWWSGDVAQAADTLGCAIADVERVLARLQSFDPSGVFARSLAECLAIQLKDRNRYDPAMAALLAHLPMLAARDLDGLRRLCGVDAEDMAEMIREIRALDPKPGARFDRDHAQAVSPDVLMRLAPDGAWIIELNPDTLPKVLVNERYIARVSRQGMDKETKDFITERLNTANWLVKSLRQRAQTIMKVSTEIVRRQDAFFTHGVQHLKPLILRDVADTVGMHESTVSRVTSNKRIATPRGVYELKYFFTTAIASSAGGEAHSAEAVRHRIKTLIDQESPKDVLSDDKIVEVLKADGVDIARRTVAKYREAMKIPSSVQRRREKQAGLK